MARQFTEIGLIGQTHHTQITNELLDVIFPMLGEADLRTFLYAYRRHEGWRFERERGGAYITFHDFTHGRKRQRDGQPLDFGTGLSLAAVQPALDRLRLSGLLELHGEPDKQGRPKKGDTRGSEYAFVRDTTRWTFRPYWHVWSFGTLGRYMLAVEHGLLPGPANEAEVRELLACLEAAAARTVSTQCIVAPQVWPCGVETPKITSSWYFMGPRGKLPVTGNLWGVVYYQKLVVIDPDKVPEAGGFSSPEAAPPQGEPTPERNLLRQSNHLTKQPTAPTLPVGGPAGAATGVTGDGADGGGSVPIPASQADPVPSPPPPPPAPPTPPPSSARPKAPPRPAIRASADGQPVTDWVAGFCSAVYTARKMEPPVTFNRDTRTLHDLRARYPLVALLACHGEMVREPRYRKAVVPIARLAEAMSAFWPRWEQRQAPAPEVRDGDPGRQDPGGSPENFGFAGRPCPPGMDPARWWEYADPADVV